MQPLAERAALVLQRLGAPAVPLPELARLLQGSGVVVSETVLLRALAAEPERFRVLDPWRAVPKLSGWDRRSRVSVAPGAGGEGEAHWLARTWVLATGRPEPRGAEPQQPALLRLRSTLVGLGRQVDPTCSTDVARWLAMVFEADRFRGVLVRDERRPTREGLTTAGEAERNATRRHGPPRPESAPTAPRAPAVRPARPRGFR